MAKKSSTNTVLLVAGAAGLAYLILHKPSAPASSIAVSPGQPANLLTQAGSLIKNLFQKQLPPAYNSDASQMPTSPQILPVSGDPTTSQLIALDQESIAGVPIDQGIQEESALSGFMEVPGTGLAVICGIGCACAGMFDPETSSGSNRISGIKKFDWTSLIVPGVVIAGGYLLLKNLGLTGGANAGNNSAIDAQTKAANQQALNSSLASGSPKTMTDSQYNSLATDIWNQVLSFTGSVSASSQSNILKDLQQCRTTSDIYALKVFFGTKQASGSFWSTCTWLNFNCQSFDLDSAVKSALSPDNLNTINQYFSGAGINYQF